MMHNILIDPLPTSVHGLRVNTCFRNMVLFSMLMQDDSLTDAEKLRAGIELVYIDKPHDLGSAVDGMVWFYTCGERSEVKGGAGEKNSVDDTLVLCFETDSFLIYSAFFSQYGIDLQEVKTMHWWKFMALFRELSAECEIKKAMYYRRCDTKNMDKNARRHVQKMKAMYRVGKAASAEKPASLKEWEDTLRRKVHGGAGI